MSTPAEVIQKLLRDLTLVTNPPDSGEWPAFISFLPDLPDSAVCVYDTAGRMDGRLMESGEQIEHPGIQIRVRGQTYTEVWEKVNSIALALDEQIRTQVSFDDYYFILHNASRVGAVIPLGIEEAGNDRRRHHFTLNMVLTLSRKYVWILAEGAWNDEGVWIDEETWEDGP